MAEYLQGIFKPTNPQKYRGNVDNIVYRSSYELYAFKLCDTCREIVKWSSEETVIPYISPIDGRMHRYFMDLTVTVMVRGIPRTTLVEVKPYKETVAPKKTRAKKEMTYLRECKTWAVNSAKWAATEEFCRKKGWHFTKWTERELDMNNDEVWKERQKRLKAQRRMKKKPRKLTSRMKKK